MNAGRKLKDQLHERLGRAIEAAGSNWKDKIIERFPEYDSKKGLNHILYADRSIKGAGYCGVDTLKEVTVALERTVGIEPQPLEV